MNMKYTYMYVTCRSVHMHTVHILIRYPTYSIYISNIPLSSVANNLGAWFRGAHTETGTRQRLYVGGIEGGKESNKECLAGAREGCLVGGREECLVL